MIGRAGPGVGGERWEVGQWGGVVVGGEQWVREHEVVGTV